ncbi:partner of bursicon-like [Asterias rubens]|uniref:partner of bursicon-like n=1 Tax=Asterias rubens TaxID=7604 RepID=UPI001455B380|nr:partner of bursicon-like [Asterias rubens]
MDYTRTRPFLIISFLQCLLVVVTAQPQPQSLGLRRGGDPAWRGRPGRCVLTFQDIEVQRQVELLTGERAVCYGTVTASACEGECMSSSLSTLHSATGFIKNCTCCRETQMTSHTVVLSPCFDVDSGDLMAGAEFVEEFQQPSGCDCQTCTIS